MDILPYIHEALKSQLLRPACLQMLSIIGFSDFPLSEKQQHASNS
jgi:hypothetical protein